MSVASATENNVTNSMQPIFILHKYMFSDIIPCGTMSELFMHGFEIAHASSLHKGLPVM